MHRVLISIPCYNEAARLDPAQVLALSQLPGVDVLLVDDGSTDDTVALHHRIVAEGGGRVVAHAMPRNVGKGEAVRAGLLRGVRDGYDGVGFLDADFATPVAEMQRVLDACHRGRAVAIASRVALAGRDIDRHTSRHYLGRVFSTVASLILDATIYDTQCGAKVFRVDDRLRDALAGPFTSRWAFDVELIGRLLTAERGAPLTPAEIVEVPLEVWRDQDGSKITRADMVKVLKDLGQMWWTQRRRRRKIQQSGAGA